MRRSSSVPAVWNFAPTRRRSSTRTHSASSPRRCLLQGCPPAPLCGGGLRVQWRTFAHRAPCHMEAPVQQPAARPWPRVARSRWRRRRPRPLARPQFDGRCKTPSSMQRVRLRRRSPERASVRIPFQKTWARAALPLWRLKPTWPPRPWASFPSARGCVTPLPNPRPTTAPRPAAAPSACSRRPARRRRQPAHPSAWRPSSLPRRSNRRR
mmetsp:Transcript_22371/g.64157  ORF Transcript_22371/g.64157 Transcript_22371/m.64157 type:complete len:210 (-) Transcript_22371:1139-1768(-)